MQTKSVKYLVLVAVAVVAVAAIYFSSRDTASQKQPAATAQQSIPQKVVINEAARTLLYLPLYHAVQKGYFKDAGLEVEIVTGGTATASFAAMISGEADFSQADPMYVPIAREKGGKVKVVSQVVGRIAVWAVSKNPEVKDISAASLRGLKIVTHPKPMTAFVYTDRLLQEAGLDPEKDVALIQAKPGTELAAFSANKADLLVAVEPATSTAVSDGAHVVHSFPTQLGDQVFSALMTREDLIAKDRPMVHKIVAAYQRSLTDIHENPAAAMESARAFFPQLPEKVLKMAVERLITDGVFPKTTAIEESSWENAIDVRVKAGDLASPSPLMDNFTDLR